ncbi:ERCC4 domain-containing protein [Mycena alexandri]|uniref:Crossover junction endonuclease MUS81 n=1 Tax=Mycena alexandri TaxID=1745969 RepID=A0AAD6TJR4_9AGAR|nr:ERCC4 domain-containing protein [Mycena alexandri]
MPRATPRYNVEFQTWIQEMRDQQEKGSNRYYAYNKALKGLQEASKEYSTPRDLIEVSGIGPGIVAALEKRYALENGGLQPIPAPVAPKPRGRSVKRSATEVDIEPPPAAKRRTVSVAMLPIHPPSAPERPAEFQFWYLDGDKRVLNRVDADTSWSEDGMLLMKVGFPLSQANHFLAAQLLRQERRGDTILADMTEDTAENFPQCTSFANVPHAPPAPKPSLADLMAADKKKNQATRLNGTNDPSRQLPSYLQNGTNSIASGSRSGANTPVSQSEVKSDMRRAATARSYSDLSQASRASSPPASQLTASPSTSRLPPPIRPPRPIARATTNVGASSSASTSASALHRTASASILHSRPRLSHVIPGLPAVEHPSLYAPLTTFPPFTPRVFKAGTYTIDLLLDHREKGKKNREVMGAALRNNGLSVDDRRALELGDVAWVARNNAGEECVLDVVLERKRLDDLTQSVRDGRFHEQKFRLHQSGISRVMYLVEEYDTHKQKENWGAQISTALSSTQVVDGFMVKETRNTDDTLAYLTGLTHELIHMHQHKDLFVIPTEIIRRHSYMDLQKYLRRTQPDKCYVTSYADFQILNSKSAFTTVRDTWTRMLLCVKGMSAEKVGAVVERWDTPRALWEAFREAQVEEQEAFAWEAAEASATGKGKGKGKGKKKSAVPEARLMLQGVGGADGGVRAIGPALSTKLYELFMSENYDE